ncbi:uncharacterized protein LOC121376469 [Gigantopelta aegis]|uniref:uncharacterized protein LOC121376469 n=1 Tax=Gigantopelta aegis TaxID=1735272 RepID=UPI001B8886FD|nr:uncharacterized protein LOC121376469 [Gigantopelta aegis]
MAFLRLVIFAAISVNCANGNSIHSSNDSTIRLDPLSVEPRTDFIHISNTGPLRLELSNTGESDSNISNMTGLSNIGISSIHSSSQVPGLNHSGVFLSGLGDISNSESPQKSVPEDKEKQTCCSAMPSICNDKGQCALDMTTCVKLCLCVTGIRGAWCHEILNSLARESAETNRPEATDLSPFAVQPSANTTDPTDSHSLTTTAHPPTNNHTVMLSTDITYNSTGSTHSANSSHRISGVPESNNTSQLSTGATGFQTHENATNLTEQYRLPKQTRSDRGEADLFDQAIKQTTPRTPFTHLTSDPNSNDSSVESEVHATPNKRENSSFASTLLSTATDHPFNINHFFRSFVTDMPNEIALPTLSSVDNDDDDSSSNNSNNGNHDKSHPCANCPGVCRLVFPSYELICEETKVDKCKNFDCGDHGTCVESNVTSLVSCRCDGMYTGTFCEHFCDLDCGDNGKCSIINNSAICVCDWNNTGEFCELLKTTVAPEVRALSGYSQPSPWNLLGIGLALFLVVVIICLVLPYWTWRRSWLPMRKLVHYFQSYEDDDGKLYDAFVSYKGSKEDEYFVVHKLYPKLEKELDFKLCLHFRDFPPGETIADNIIHAIENSRRTILILSPSFVESEWCRLEYQKAQQEMLKLKHKIIPIMLQDITDVTNVDKNLKQIINTVTFIRWPGEEVEKRVDKFWQLMQCSMPKKKTDTAGSESSLGSCSSQKPLTSATESCCLDTLSDDVFSSSDSTSSHENNDKQDITSKTISNSNNSKQKTETTASGNQVQITTLFIENETENTNSKSKKHDIDNLTKPAYSKSLIQSKNTNSANRTLQLSKDRDENVIQIERLPGNKLKAWKVYSNSSSNTTESYS